MEHSRRDRRSETPTNEKQPGQTPEMVDRDPNSRALLEGE